MCSMFWLLITCLIISALVIATAVVAALYIYFARFWLFVCDNADKSSKKMFNLLNYFQWQLFCWSVQIEWDLLRAGESELLLWLEKAFCKTISPRIKILCFTVSLYRIAVLSWKWALICIGFLTECTKVFKTRNAGKIEGLNTNAAKLSEDI